MEKCETNEKREKFQRCLEWIDFMYHSSIVGFVFELLMMIRTFSKVLLMIQLKQSKRS